MVQENPLERRLLGPYVDCIDEFRIMMRKYSAIITGDSVLHLFSPSENWTPTKLDLFVSSDSLGQQGEILWHVFLTSTCKFTFDGSQGDHCLCNTRYFRYIKDNKTIDMTIVDRHPISFVIDRFYGTHLLNYATSDKAYCLFPQLTLEARKMVVFTDLTATARHSFDNYSTFRGFGHITIRDASLHYPELSLRRSTGDSLCLIESFSTIDVSDVGTSQQDSPLYFELTAGEMRVIPQTEEVHSSESCKDISYDSEDTVLGD
jgi:hypothetical protein